VNRAVVALLGTAVATLALDRHLRHAAVPGGRRRWTRHNHAGHEVTLLEGVAFVGGTAAPLLLLDPAAALVTLGAGLTGAADDLHPDAVRKGLKGHLGALARGEVTVGALKIAGLLATGLAGAAPGSRRRPVVDTLVRAAIVAASANLANLLDLRPGRALKVGLLTGIPLALRRDGTPAAAAVGAATVLLRDDLQGVSMLGDTGANPLGALVGLAAARSGGRAGRVATLAGLTALTLASERVSFTRVIESTPGLRELDAWGRPTR
jgi:UDP-N-acetylmuramyl pentapeptide phosphotransferase/UDP-N-acetylglucosamine-1-phosphate transferase